MKIVSILIIFATVALSLSHPATDGVRNLTRGFFEVVKGTNWTLSDDCLSGASDVDLVKIIAAAQNHDFITAALYFSDLISVLKKSCPIAELEEVSHQITKAITHGDLIANIIHNFNAIIKTVQEDYRQDIDNYSFGKLSGKLYKLIILKTPHNVPAIRFLSDEPVLTGNATQLLIGFIEGTSDVALEQNQCLAGTKSFLPDLAAALMDIINAIKSKHGIKDAFIKFMATAVRLKDVEGNCHLISLAMSLVTLTNPITLAKITWRITKNISTVIGKIKGVAGGIKSDDLRAVGNNLGGLFSIVFDFHTH